MSSGKRLTEGDPEELIECPFDAVHLLRRKRMPYHIMKCGQNHNLRDFTFCSFNYRHIMPKDQMQAHLEVCEDRCIVEREILQTQQSIGEVSGLKGYTGIPVSTFQPPPPEESWDDSNVVVDIAPNRGYYSKETNEKLPEFVEDPLRPPEPPRVKDPPNPRLPAMSGVSGSEVFKLATTDVGGGSPPRDKPRGRGRGGRGTVPSPPKVGGMNKAGSSPEGASGGSPSRPVGRGRGVSKPVWAEATDRPGPIPGPVDQLGPTDQPGPIPGPVDQLGPVNQLGPTDQPGPTDEAKKKERKLKKMLKQILELEEKAKTQTLNEDQIAKLSRKEDVLSMLEQMHLS